MDTPAKPDMPREAPQPSMPPHQKPAWRSRAAVYLQIGIGSVIGSELRWFVALGFTALFGTHLPWGTLFENVTGSFAIGMFAALTGPDGRLFVGARTRQFVMTGICGGYTTFSLFSLEIVHFIGDGRFGRALLYFSLSVSTWLIAAWAGHALATRLNRLKGAP